MESDKTMFDNKNREQGDTAAIELEVPLSKNGTTDDFEESVREIAGKKEEKQKAAESGGRILWRGANVMMTVFFVMAAGVQFNDPDPFLWVPLYGTASILTSCVAIRPNLSGHKRWKCVYWIHTLFCIGMFFYVLVELVMVAVNPLSDGSLNPLTYEEGREMAGIMITSIWLFICKQSPTIRCTFPRWCGCCMPSSSPQTINTDVFVDMGQSSLLTPESRI